MRDACRQVLERLAEAATGSVSPAVREGIAEHLATCAACRQEAADLEATAAHLRDGGAFAVPPGFWNVFTTRLSARLAPERLPIMLRLRRWLTSPRHAWGTAVATAAMGIAIALGVRIGTPTGELRPDPLEIRARGLVTETMTTTLPSLGDILDTWRAGLSPDSSHDGVGP